MTSTGRVKILQAVRNQSARIAAHVEDSKLFTHRGDRGTFRERIIADFLRPFLPDRYGLGAGEVFAADGTQSAQGDIVIYDAFFSTVLFRNGPVTLFPAESVFGSIEVKSELDRRELIASIENVGALKRLPRAASDMMDFLPDLRFNVGNEFGYDRTKRNPYIAIVFGDHGIAPETVLEELNRRVQDAPEAKGNLPDFVFVAEPGYIFARVQEAAGKLHIQGMGQDFRGFISLRVGPDALPLFYLALNVSLSNMRLRSISFQSLWQSLFEEVLTRAKS